MLCIVECTGSDTELPCGRYGVVRVFFVSEHLLQLVYHLILEFGALVTMQGFWWAENADYSLDYGIGYCFGRFITYRQQYQKSRQLVHHGENVSTFDLCG